MAIIKFKFNIERWGWQQQLSSRHTAGVDTQACKPQQFSKVAITQTQGSQCVSGACVYSHTSISVRLL